MYFSNAVMMRLKAKKRKIIRTHPESSKVPLVVRREEKELEGLLSLQEWLRVFMETCSGLWQLGPPYYRRILHFIYCAVTLNKFSSVTRSLSSPSRQLPVEGPLHKVPITLVAWV